MAHNTTITSVIALLERVKQIALPTGVNIRDDITFRLIHDEIVDEAIHKLHALTTTTTTTCALHSKLLNAEECMSNSKPRLEHPNNNMEYRNSKSYELISVNQHAIAKAVITRTFDAHLRTLRKELQDAKIECEH